jgi:spermidine synthase
MVEIDEEVTELSRKYLPFLNGGAFLDKRAQVHHLDARGYLEKNQEKYDVIIIDLPDPVEEGPAYLLFTQEFYKIALARLTENGMMAVQAGSASPTELLNLTAVSRTLKSVFPVVVQYTTYMQSFGGPWGFCLASRGIDLSLSSPSVIDKTIKSKGLKGLRFYDGITHRNMFSLPKYIREALAAQQRIITDKKPLYLYGK